MNYMDDASTFEHSLLQKARQKHIPVTGALELLPLCNMNCDMCYVRLSRSEMERQGRLRTVEEWAEGRYRFSSSDRWGAAALSGF